MVDMQAIASCLIGRLVGRLLIRRTHLSCIILLPLSLTPPLRFILWNMCLHKKTDSVTWCCPISTSVPLTSPWASTQTKMCVFAADRTQPHESGACRRTGRAHRCKRCIYCRTSEPKQCFEDKIAKCPFKVELQTDRASGWLSGGSTGRKVLGIQSGGDWLIGLDADSGDWLSGWTSDSLVG